MKPIKLAFLLSAVAFVALQVFYYSQMPETVATHFDFAGRPNGWMSRTTNLIVSCALMVFVASIFWFVPAMVKWKGGLALNVPHKKYWLAPENVQRLLAIVERYMCELGLATTLFFIYLFHQIYQFNTGSTGRVSMMGLAVFLIALAAITIRWFRRLNDVPKAA